MKQNSVGITFLKFANQQGGKVRPVLVVKTLTDRIDVLPITSKFETKSKKIQKQYYQIADWHYAGLVKPSWIDIFGGRTLPLDQIDIKKIGQLSVKDSNQLEMFIKNFFAENNSDSH